jgi:serine/threonine protein kinase
MACASPLKTRVLSGKYALGRVLGAGGWGTVYESENLLVGRQVAIKVLHPDIARDADRRTAFLAEARTTARVPHENVVDILDIGLDRDGATYIVMELLAGETLEQILEARGTLPVPDACELAAQILSAVSAAHRAGIIHRDLKPANVLVTYPEPDRPRVKLLDFGIAEGGSEQSWLARTGTPLYMPPEQALGHPLDERADVYAVGAMLYELLAGVPPFPLATPEAILRASRRGQFEPLEACAPDVPAELAATIHAALSAVPDERPPSAEAMHEAVAFHTEQTWRSRVRPRSLCSHPLPAASTSEPCLRLVDIIPASPRVPVIARPSEPEALCPAGVADADAEQEDWQPPRRSSWSSAALALVSGLAIGSALCWWLVP